LCYLSGFDDFHTRCIVSNRNVHQLHSLLSNGGR
jgi:hypothetical protein